MSLEPRLAIARLRLVFRSGGALRLPPHAGFAWRGAFGWALKRTVCAMRLRPCEGCMLAASCIYPYVFETAPPDSARQMTRYDRVPHPFALDTGPISQRSVEEGDRVSLVLTVFGNASRHIPYFLRAFEIAGQKGLTGRRVPLILEYVEQLPVSSGESSKIIYRPGQPVTVPSTVEPTPAAYPGQAEIVFSSSLRLKRDEGLVRPDNLSAADLLISLTRRISMLMYFHSNEALSADFPALKSLAEHVNIRDRHLRWLDLTRKSSRQDTLMKMGGIVGSVVFDLSGAASLWPYLWLGQFTQVGKGTTMGLGCYRVVVPENPASFSSALDQ